MRVFIIVTVLCWFFAPAQVFADDAPKDYVIAPNVFTPNGDGINDVFEVRSNNGNKVWLRVYTRAGVLVFEDKAERCRWDGYSQGGDKMPEGVYIFIAEIETSPKVPPKNGFVHLFR